MKSTLTALFAVATELGELAKSSMPEIREGEVINREWLENGVYYRETALNDRLYLASFNFRQRTSRQVQLLK